MGFVDLGAVEVVAAWMGRIMFALELCVGFMLLVGSGVLGGHSLEAHVGGGVDDVVGLVGFDLGPRAHFQDDVQSCKPNINIAACTWHISRWAVVTLYSRTDAQYEHRKSLKHACGLGCDDM